MKVLFVHQNFPGQYRALAPALQRAGHDVMALSGHARATERGGIPHVGYEFKHATGTNIHPLLASTESAVARGEAVANVVRQLHQQGWTPDAVLGHCGWGEMLYLRDVLPRARLLGFCEYYYRTHRSDVNFDPEFQASADVAQKLHTRNFHLGMSLVHGCDWGVAPTHWQAEQFPDMLRSRIRVIHDGIDTNLLTPDASSFIKLGRDGVVARPGDEIVTFVNRNLEPLRGYHQFMRALPDILERRPRARAVIVGGDGVSYGAQPKNAKGYKQRYLDEVKDRLDMSRVHFVSKIPYATLVNLLRVSAAHVYFTYPFVLSWSMLEAMSLGALVIGSATPPVQEVIEHEKNGLLVDFFSPEQLAHTVCEALARPGDFRHLREQARRTVVDRYDFERVCLPSHLQLLARD